MISEEQFTELENKYGCGYWNVCWEHACPCAITTENKGLREDIYNDLIKEAKEVAESFKKDDSYLYYKDELDDYDDLFDEEYDSDRLLCGCCACCGCSCDDSNNEFNEDESSNNY